ncbi:MAG: LD-carboxypeptidase [Ignavibacteriales bacterium]|nr:LD-carboxypeptidase [Ignavibacteriales bacterium]
MKIVKPPRLRKGDVIGLVSPASAPSSPDKIEKSTQYLEHLGYRVKIGKHVMDEVGYLAGRDEDRTSDLNEMFRDRSVRAIIAVRGGYGTPRILRRIDFQAVKRDPKIIVGYSDLTSLQLALFRKTGLITFSGPMAGVEMWNDIDPYTEEHFWKVITSTTKIGLLENPPDVPLRSHGRGKGSGRLMGGNLSCLMSNHGTPYAADYRKAVLVVEDVDEAPHRVDRMFAQLRNAGVFKTITALLLGCFTDCHPPDPSKPHLTIDQVLAEVIESSPVPVLSNLQYGHIPRKLTLPIGSRTRVSASHRTLEIVESAVR